MMRRSRLSESRSAAVAPGLVPMSGLVESKGNGVRVRVRAAPRASRTEVVGVHGDALKMRIAAPPVDGAANAELIRFMAKRLGVPQSRVRIVSGDSGRSKIVEIEGVDPELVRRTLLG